MLEKQSGVALLVHDFSEGSTAPGGEVLTGEYSITLNGTCSVINDGEIAIILWALKCGSMH